MAQDLSIPANRFQYQKLDYAVSQRLVLYLKICPQVDWNGLLRMSIDRRCKVKCPNKIHDVQHL